MNDSHEDLIFDVAEEIMVMLDRFSHWVACRLIPALVCIGIGYAWRMVQGG